MHQIAERATGICRAWLTRPALPTSEAERRRARYLSWLLIALMVLTCSAILLVLVAEPPGDPRRDLYALMIAALLLPLALADGLNQRGHYSSAAGLIVSCALIGPWASILLDPTVLRGDFIPLMYTALTVLLCSLLLSPRATPFLAALQFIALLCVPAFSPAAAAFNWPSLLAYYFFMAVLSIVASYVSHQDMRQIDQQAIHLAEGAASMREQSVRDVLTSLYNRRYLDETLARELRRLERSHGSLAVLMVDVDRFKVFNDAHGHAEGDALLREVGLFLRRNVRDSDFACRYDGDEFTLVMPDASLDVAKLRAEFLRTHVPRIPHMHHENESSAITLSVGIAIAPAQGVTASALLKAADSALYRAKHAGRDRVVVSQTA